MLVGFAQAGALVAGSDVATYVTPYACRVRMWEEFAAAAATFR